jgi:UMF1 family MFS transporter
MRRLNRQIWGWAIYDWANSAFAVSVLTIVLPVYFAESLATSGTAPDGALLEGVVLFGRSVPGASLWGWTVSFSMLFVVLLTPIVGAIADYTGKKKRFLMLFCFLGASATGLMVLLGAGMWKLGILLFVLANVCFVGGNVVYNGLLVEVAETEEKVAFVSGFGWALGYMASFLMLLFNLALIKFEIPSAEWAVRLSLLSVGVWWALFAIPTYLWVKEKTQPRPLPEGQGLLSVGFTQLKVTARELRFFPQLLLFIGAFFLYNDGIQTVINQASIFALEVFQKDLEELIPVFLMIQIVAFFGSLLFIRVEGKLGTKKTLLASLFIWVLLIGWAFFMHDFLEFWILAFFGGLVLGVSQSASRTIFAWMIPPQQSAEFFSLYAIVGKAASVVGPFLFGVGAAFAVRLEGVPLVNTMALAVLPLFLMVLVGFLMLLKVDVEKGKGQVLGLQSSESRSNHLPGSR